MNKVKAADAVKTGTNEMFQGTRGERKLKAEGRGLTAEAAWELAPQRWFSPVKPMVVNATSIPTTAAAAATAFTSNFLGAEHWSHAFPTTTAH